MVTAYGDRHARKSSEGRRAGFITKPIDFKLLREEIAERLKPFQGRPA